MVHSRGGIQQRHWTRLIGRSCGPRPSHPRLLQQHPPVPDKSVRPAHDRAPNLFDRSRPAHACSGWVKNGCGAAVGSVMSGSPWPPPDVAKLDARYWPSSAIWAPRVAGGSVTVMVWGAEPIVSPLAVFDAVTF